MNIPKFFKHIIFIIVFLSLSSNVFAVSTVMPSYMPYSDSEFSPWMKKLRRAEIITLGATALTYPLVGLIPGVKSGTDSQFFSRFALAAGAGVVIALVDYLIGEFDNKPQPTRIYREISPEEFEQSVNFEQNTEENAEE